MPCGSVSVQSDTFSLHNGHSDRRGAGAEFITKPCVNAPSALVTETLRSSSVAGFSSRRRPGGLPGRFRPQYVLTSTGVT
eukprot:COSAG01_NODE_160_length_23692_cov_9.703599_8_plen_80_part_00